MPDLQRNKKESFEAFFRRFTTRLRTSKKLVKIRKKKRGALPSTTKRKRKQRALHGIELQKKREHLTRIGKIKEKIRRW